MSRNQETGTLPGTINTPPVQPSPAGPVSFLTFAGILTFHSVFYLVLFGSVWVQGKSFCSGDAIRYYYPAYVGGHNLWEPGLVGGYPKFADPQFHLWYPLALVFSFLHIPYDLYAMSAYALAGTFAHAYLRRLTGSWTAGCLAGIAYSTCGFMTCHNGATTVTHVPVWLPLILWAIEELRLNARLVWISVLAGAVASCILAGHPQISLLCLVVAAIYFVHLIPGAPAGPGRFTAAVVGGVVLGGCLSVIQLLPTAEFSSMTTRSVADYQFFCSYQFPRSLLPTLFFPYAYGSPLSTPPPLILNELYTPVEWLANSTLLAVVGVFAALLCGFRQRRVWFWIAVLAFALLAALGDDGPLAPLLFRVPLLNKFRCPGRFGLWFSMACACLTGQGVALLLRMSPSRAWRAALAACCLALLLAGIALFVYRGQRFQAPFDANAVARLPADSPYRSGVPWVNPALGIPLLCLVLSGGSLLAHVRFRNRLSQLALLAATIFDGVSFAWPWALGVSCASMSLFQSPPGFAEVREALHRHHTRLFTPVDSWAMPVMANTNLLIGVDNACYAGPLLPERYARLYAHPEVLWPLLAVEYAETAVQPTPSGPSCLDGLAPVRVGSPQLHGIKECRLLVPDRPITGLAIISCLGLATGVAQGTPVVEVLVRGVDGTESRTEMQAGRDTAEWSLEAVECRHRRAPVFQAIPTHDGNGRPFTAYRFLGQLHLDQAVEAREVVLRWVGTPYSCCELFAVTLHGPAGEFYPYVGPALAGRQFPPRAIQGTNFWLTQAASTPPRAWLVPEALSLPAKQVEQTLTTQRLPDGRPFDLYQTVLVEEALNPIHRARDPNASVEILQELPSTVRLRTRSAEPAVLVLSDSWYPGWQVCVDGKPTRLLRADYLIRAVEVPPGEHQVTFVFRPRTFYLGAPISLAALLLVLGLPLLGPARLPWGSKGRAPKYTGEAPRTT
jgi:hypothetical protein